MSSIAIIPARSGSKGLKDKNIKELKGKPLLAYSVEAAVESGMFDVVHVSTDSQLYADIAAEYGADQQFLRPDELSGDKADSWDAVRYTISEYEKMGYKFDSVMLLQPTSPLRKDVDIVASFDLMKEREANAVIGVCETDHPPIFADIIADDGNMKGFVKEEHRNLPRQAVPKYYRVNGAIYLLKVEMLDNINGLYDNGCYAYVMDRKDSVDIDTIDDFEYAEFLMR